VAPYLSDKYENRNAEKSNMETPMTLPKIPMSIALNPKPPFSRLVAIQIGVSSAPVRIANVRAT
jgi:hypothetical protein